MSKGTKQYLAYRFFSRDTAPTYDLVVNLFTYGADRHWKGKILQKIDHANMILDLACGTGILTFLLARKFPKSTVIGVDVTPEYIALARKKQKQFRVKNIHFICGRAEEIGLQTQFDCITSSYIPKYVPAENLLTNVTPLLKPSGKIILHDFTCPPNRFFRILWNFHIGLMKILGSPFFPAWKIVFHELGDFIRSTHWLNEYHYCLKNYQFKNVTIEFLTAGSSAIISALK